MSKYCSNFEIIYQVSLRNKKKRIFYLYSFNFFIESLIFSSDNDWILHYGKMAALCELISAGLIGNVVLKYDRFIPLTLSGKYQHPSITSNFFIRSSVKLSLLFENSISRPFHWHAPFVLWSADRYLLLPFTE